MKLSLGKKIGFGFALSLLFTLIVGGTGYYSLGNVKKGSSFYQAVSKTQILFSIAKEEMAQYMMYRFPEGRQQQKEAFLRSKALFLQSKKLMDDQQVVIDESQLQEILSKNSDNIQKYIDNYKELNNSEAVLIQTESLLNQTMAEMEKLLPADLFLAENLIRNTKVLFAETSQYFLKKHEDSYLKVDTLSTEQNKAIKKWTTQVESSEELNLIAGKLDALFLNFTDLIEQNHTENITGSAILDRMKEQEKTLKDTFESLEQLTISRMESVEKRAKITIVVGMGIAFLAGIFVVIFLVKGITGAVNRITRGMNEGSMQVAAASDQVSSSSQSMAEGASQQAASIEEISSSVEEMASMTKKNAENAIHADGLMKEANQVVKSANESMTQLTRSMADISKASEDTSRIIKTIDEIAFQTNLLALNAAVEAARAGEAGAGFAVVADEVRNLAMRAADAAKDTEKLIQETLLKVNEGSTLVTDTNNTFEVMSTSTGKVGSLIFEISEASNEQSDGIEQINIAIADVDQVVQQTAANAEESAAAAEQMKSQAEKLREYVNLLILLVTGKRGQNTEAPTPQHQEVVTEQNALAASQKESSQKNEIRADQVIPFDEDTF